MIRFLRLSAARSGASDGIYHPIISVFVIVVGDKGSQS